MQKYRESILYIVCLIIALIFSISKLQPQIVSIMSINNEIKNKTIEAADLERKLETLKAKEIESMDTSSQTKKIYKPEESGLDAESSFAVVFDDIIEMAKYNGIKVYAIEYLYNPPEDEFVKGDASKYNVCQLNMQIIADYADLESFIKELFKYPYLINISKLEISPYAKNKKILVSNIQLKLYSLK